MLLSFPGFLQGTDGGDFTDLFSGEHCHIAVVLVDTAG